MLQIGWLTLVVGVGVSRGIDEATGVDVGLKWPNDLVTDDGKVAGILAERLPDGSVVMGIGINVDQERAELPETGTSLRLLGSTAPRQRVLTRVLGAVAATYRDWRAGEGIADAYLARSRTIGQQVRVNGFNSEVIGRAEGLDDAGRLLVRDDQGVLHALSAGDVIHLRG